jgi:hypothetical protein
MFAILWENLSEIFALGSTGEILSAALRNDLLTVYKVAREFESRPLRHAVWQVGDYRCRTTKSALLTKIILYATRGGPR